MKPKYTAKTLLIDLIFDFAGCLLYAAALNCFIIPNGLASGGVSGIALIIHHLTGLPTGTVTFVLNIPIIFLCLKILGKVFLLKSIKTLAILTLCIDVISVNFPVYSGEKILAALAAGLMVGAGLALTYLRGSSTGGGDFITLSVRKLYPHFSIGMLTQCFDYIVLTAGAIVFGDIDAALYGAIAMFMAGQIMDKIMYGSNKGKLLLIVTDKGQEVADGIFGVIERGATVCDVRGGYSKGKKQLVISAVSKHQLPKARKAAHEADPMAFTMITNTDEVFGEGFIDPRED